MSSKFKIIKHRDGGNLHLILSGDFNDDSAQKLLDILNKGHNGVNQMIVDTSGLDDFHFIDKPLFTIFMDEISKQPFVIVFTGKYSKHIV